MSHLQAGYNPVANHLLNSWDIQVAGELLAPTFVSLHFLNPGGCFFCVHLPKKNQVGQHPSQAGRARYPRGMDMELS